MLKYYEYQNIGLQAVFDLVEGSQVYKDQMPLFLDQVKVLCSDYNYFVF